MTQSEFIEIVASYMGSSKAAAHRATKAVIAGITDVLLDGDSISFAGFGTFITRKTNDRIGHNPATGEKINIPAKILPKFKTSSGLKAKLNATDKD